MDNTERALVLIADDEPTTAKLLAHMIESEYETVTAGRGMDALALAFARRPDLILLDIEMPDMDGYEVCAALKANTLTQDISVMFITAHGGASQETRALEMGAVDFIEKPPIPAVVRARVRTHVTLKRQSDALRLLSNTDALTGMPNRRRFFELAGIEMSRIRRNGQALSLLMLDIDRFKAINDTYGHAAGDRALQSLSRVSRKELRQMDVTARIGGEEFAIILPETDRDDALHVAERLRIAVAKETGAPGYETSANQDIPPMTVSIGVATAVKEDPDIHTVLARADAALYQAKSGGRNKVVVA